ncbi:unnamed protein product [Protopolystoma xenopodis]|uniref:Uncharacterized protein n=1 Tax=Protopolystoma xenopodis TaxID=117903 RepID=A0A448WWQ4_9PLAT|nr:unnamed protein product [Protopolystoma xenopodis]
MALQPDKQGHVSPGEILTESGLLSTMTSSAKVRDVEHLETAILHAPPGLRIRPGDRLSDSPTRDQDEDEEDGEEEEDEEDDDNGDDDGEEEEEEEEDGWTLLRCQTMAKANQKQAVYTHQKSGEDEAEQRNWRDDQVKQYNNLNGPKNLVSSGRILERGQKGRMPDRPPPAGQATPPIADAFEIVGVTNTGSIALARHQASEWHESESGPSSTSGADESSFEETDDLRIKDRGDGRPGNGMEFEENGGIVNPDDEDSDDGDDDAVACANGGEEGGDEEDYAIMSERCECTIPVLPKLVFTDASPLDKLEIISLQKDVFPVSPRNV